MSSDNLLLVMDVQEKPMRFLRGKAKLMKRINRIIKLFEERNEPIFYVKQENCGSLCSQLEVKQASPVFTKKNHDAFSQPSLAEKVQQLHPQNLVVIGLMSHDCIQATVKDALERNYSVILIGDAHDSLVKPMRHHYNQILTKLGAHRLSTEEFLQVE